MIKHVTRYVCDRCQDAAEKSGVLYDLPFDWSVVKLQTDDPGVSRLFKYELCPPCTKEAAAALKETA